jgi:hypothetical protein
MLTSQQKLLLGAVEAAIYLAVTFDAGPAVITHLQNAARTLKLPAGANVHD